jgi:tetratricopeptide (TPR) repeat protein
MRNLILLIICSLIPVSAYSQVSSEKLIRKGVSLHDQGHYAEAIDYYEQALKINPSSMSATYEMALSYLHKKDYDNALKYSTKVINANFLPLIVDAYCVKSSALAELGKIDQSVTLLNEALKRCGDEYLLHYNMGLSYFKKQDLPSAINHLRKAIEIETTHSNAFLLYAYALNDSGQWLQSFFAFHFFLLLEPNTDRSKDAFNELYDMLITVLPSGSPLLLPEDGIDRDRIYEFLQQNKPVKDTPEARFAFFRAATEEISLTLSRMQSNERKGLLWDFFVPIYSEILSAGYMDVYCRYVSVSQIPASLEWWSKNTAEVDEFIAWFEGGSDEEIEGEEFGDDLVE